MVTLWPSATPLGKRYQPGQKDTQTDGSHIMYIYVAVCSEQVNCSGPPLSARERCMAKMIISMCLCYLATNLPVSAIKLSRGNDSNDIPNIRLFFSFLFWSQYRYTQFGL